MEDNNILEDISSLSEYENDDQYIKDIKIQSVLLASLGIFLFFLALEIKLNQGQILGFFLNQSAINHPSIFFVFLIASVGNLIASHLLYSEARCEERQLKKLKAAFLANSSLK
jgi:uncharacterized integral membrane protein